MIRFRLQLVKRETYSPLQLARALCDNYHRYSSASLAIHIEALLHVAEPDERSKIQNAFQRACRYYAAAASKPGDVHLVHVRDLKRNREYWQWFDTYAGRKVPGTPQYSEKKWAKLAEQDARIRALDWHRLNPRLSELRHYEAQGHRSSAGQ